MTFEPPDEPSYSCCDNPETSGHHDDCPAMLKRIIADVQSSESEIWNRLGAHLLQLEAELRLNVAHSCKHCHYYACGGDNHCRCWCGRVRQTIEAHIEGLKAVILPKTEEGNEEEAEIEPLRSEA